MELKNKVIWITGASSGIGEALALLYAKNGAKIILSSRNVKELERVKKQCEIEEKNILILPLDLSQHNDMEEKAKIVLEKFSRIDILINNGGISQRSLVTETDLKMDKKIMDINFFGAVALTKSVLPQMIKQKSGNIIVMSSLTGKIGVPMRSAYAASKHALHGFFDTLRAEIWKENITVLLVCPGYVKTNISVNALNANGLPHNKQDASFNNAKTTEYVANKIVKAVKKNKKELLIGGKEIMGAHIKRFFPNLFFKIIQNHKEKIGK